MTPPSRRIVRCFPLVMALWFQSSLSIATDHPQCRARWAPAPSGATAASVLSTPDVGSETDSVGDPGSPTLALAAPSRAFKDPRSGRWTLPPPGSGLRAQALSPVPTTFPEGLEEAPGPENRGGVKVDLAGRFRSAVVVHKLPDGRLEMDCEAGGEGAPARPLTADRSGAREGATTAHGGGR